MTSYYDIVSYLDKMINMPISDEHINNLNNATVSLEGDRYIRFINQINYVVTERLRNIMDKVIDTVCERYLDLNELTLELNNIRSEVAFAQKITSINMIKEENKRNFWQSIIKNNNEIYEEIKKLYDEDDFLFLINGYIIKEN